MGVTIRLAGGYSLKIWQWLRLKASYRYRVECNLRKRVQRGRRLLEAPIAKTDLTRWLTGCKTDLALYFHEDSSVFQIFDKETVLPSANPQELRRACDQGLSILEEAIDLTRNPDLPLNSPQKLLDNTLIRYAAKGLLGLVVGGGITVTAVTQGAGIDLNIDRNLGLQGASTPVAPTSRPAEASVTATATRLAEPLRTPTAVPTPTSVPSGFSVILEPDPDGVVTRRTPVISLRGTCTSQDTFYIVMQSIIRRANEPVSRDYWIQARVECASNGSWRSRAFMCFDGGEYQLHIWRGRNEPFVVLGKAYANELEAWYYTGQADDYAKWYLDVTRQTTGGRPPTGREVLLDSSPYIFDWDRSTGTLYQSCGAPSTGQ